METLILIASSVLTTLGIILVVWLISSVRSAQKQLKDYDGEIPELHRRIEEESQNIYQCLDNLKIEYDRNFDDLHNDLDKRFDNSYRTMYEFRDWSKEQIERLIETDLTNKQ